MMHDDPTMDTAESTEPPELVLLRSLLASLHAASPASSPTPTSPAWGDGNPRAQAIAHPAHSRVPTACPAAAAALPNYDATDMDRWGIRAMFDAGRWGIRAISGEVSERCKLS